MQIEVSPTERRDRIIVLPLEGNRYRKGSEGRKEVWIGSLFCEQKRKITQTATYPKTFNLSQIKVNETIVRVRQGVLNHFNVSCFHDLVSQACAINMSTILPSL